MDIRLIVKLLAGVAVLMLLWSVWHKRSGPSPMSSWDWDSEDEDDQENEADSDAEYADDEELDGGDQIDGAEGFDNALLSTSARALPKPAAGGSQDWSKFAPKALGAQNFLTGSQLIGINTQGSSRKNASRDLRGDPIIPKRVIAPWMESSIDPDLHHKPL